jgi:hypothetical protein
MVRAREALSATDVAVQGVGKMIECWPERAAGVEAGDRWVRVVLRAMERALQRRAMVSGLLTGARAAFQCPAEMGARLASRERPSVPWAIMRLPETWTVMRLVHISVVASRIVRASRARRSFEEVPWRKMLAETELSVKWRRVRPWHRHVP